jgi:hypothetical protein
MTTQIEERTSVIGSVFDWFVAKAYERLTPFVVQHQRAQLDEIGHALRVFAADVEREARAQEPRVDRCLDSQDVRLSLGDLRERTEQLISSIRIELVDADQLQRFLDIARDLAVGGIRTAVDAEDVGDTVSRAIDNVAGYMHGNGLIHRQSQDRADRAQLMFYVSHHVLKVEPNVTVGEAIQWRRRVRGGPVIGRNASGGSRLAADDRVIVA